MAGAEVAQHRVVAAREHRRPPAPQGADDPMADGVHPAEEHVEAPGGDPAVDLAMREPRRDELPAGHDAALALRERGDDPIRADFTTHTVV